MKKIILSGIMAVALVASTCVVAQNVTPTTPVKKEAKAQAKEAKKNVQEVKKDVKAEAKAAKSEVKKDAKTVKKEVKKGANEVKAEAKTIKK